MAGRQHAVMVDVERSVPMTYVFLVRRPRLFYGRMLNKGERIRITPDEDDGKKLSRALSLSSTLSGTFLLEETITQAEDASIVPAAAPSTVAAHVAEVKRHRNTLTRMTPSSEEEK